MFGYNIYVVRNIINCKQTNIGDIMSKLDINNEGEEVFLRRSERGSTQPPQDKQVKIVKNVDFESSLDSFSSKDCAKGRKRRSRKRKLGVNGALRLVSLCLCIAVFIFSGYKIIDRSVELSAAEEYYASLRGDTQTSIVSHPKEVRRVKFSEDLLTYLGSDGGGIETLDTATQNYYETLRDRVVNCSDPNCVGYIVVSGTNIDYPVFKTTDNDYYLHHQPDGKSNSAGAIFLDYRLSDNFDDNMNVVVYGHCMTNGSMFRGIKLFFDSEYRYTRAQEMEITFVTADGVYIYEYFSGYRSEGSKFVSMFTDNGTNKAYYSFLQSIRARNTISKNVGYNANSKIITLVTCTNVPSKPGERYALHGILKEHFTFE